MHGIAFAEAISLRPEPFKNFHIALRVFLQAVGDHQIGQTVLVRIQRAVPGFKYPVSFAAATSLPHWARAGSNWISFHQSSSPRNRPINSFGLR